MGDFNQDHSHEPEAVKDKPRGRKVEKNQLPAVGQVGRPPSGEVGPGVVPSVPGGGGGGSSPVLELVVVGRGHVQGVLDQGVLLLVGGSGAHQEQQAQG